MRNLRNKGQLMILTVLILGGIIISAAGLIGYLMINNLRQATDIESSVKAIYAADAGREWEMWRVLTPNNFNQINQNCPVFHNQAGFTIGIGVLADATTSFQIISAGTAGKDTRAWSGGPYDMNENSPTSTLSNYVIPPISNMLKSTCP